MTQLQIPARRYIQEDITICIDLEDILDLPEEFETLSEWIAADSDKAYAAIDAALENYADELREMGYNDEGVETGDAEYTSLELYLEDWEHG